MSAPSLSFQPPTPKAVLGANVLIQGQIRSREDLTIEGEVDGTIEMLDHRLTIASNGNVRADVKVREVEVRGSIQGKIEAAEKVFVRKTAHIVGDILSAAIIVEDGGYIKGNVELSKESATAKV